MISFQIIYYIIEHIFNSYYFYFLNSNDLLFSKDQYYINIKNIVYFDQQDALICISICYNFLITVHE